jgi:hypothetical protein|tara:strand:- start:405 stop:731 length:327 start_codon:yes stop_codon:yes gene_type:complete
MVKPRYEETSAEVVEMLKKAIALEERIEKAEIAKAEHHNATSFSTEPSSAQFMIETGGQTYNAFYDTNQSLLDAQDVANKGATKTNVELDGARVNPQDRGYEGHVTEG